MATELHLTQRHPNVHHLGTERSRWEHCVAGVTAVASPFEETVVITGANVSTI